MKRIIALIDMDCFYMQVEQRENPALRGVPCAVVQYNTWKGGCTLAVSYEARDRGVKRGLMRGDDAKAVCPEIQLVRVPEVRGKADLTKYRDASGEVMQILAGFGCCLERASIDEAFLDLTDEVERRFPAGKSFPPDDVSALADKLAGTYVVGWEKQLGNENSDENKDEFRACGLRDWLLKIRKEDDDLEGSCVDDQRLAIGGVIVEEMREAVYRETGFRCSAGVSHNKMLAKLACGLHKPNKQTILPKASVSDHFMTCKINKVRNFGGKLGQELMSEFRVEFMGDILRVTLSELQKKFGEKLGSWLYGACRGEDDELVVARQVALSIGCSKNFLNEKDQLNTKQKVKHWLEQFASELEERLVKDRELNARAARLLTVTVGYRDANNGYRNFTRSCPILHYEAKRLASDAFNILLKFNSGPVSSEGWVPAFTHLGMMAGKFVDNEASSGNCARNSILSFLRPITAEREKSATLEASNSHEGCGLARNDVTLLTNQKSPARKRNAISEMFQRIRDSKKVLRVSENQNDRNPIILMEDSNPRIEDEESYVEECNLNLEPRDPQSENGIPHEEEESSVPYTMFIDPEYKFDNPESKHIDPYSSQFINPLFQGINPSHNPLTGQSNPQSENFDPDLEGAGMNSFTSLSRSTQSLSRPAKSLSRPAESLSHPVELLSHTAESLSHLAESLSHPAESLSRPSQSISNQSQSLSRTSQSLSHLFKSISRQTDSLSHPSPSLSHPSESLSHQSKSLSHVTRSLSPPPTSVSHVPTSPTKDPVDYTYCEKCRTSILVWNFPEHSDFHVAQDLHKSELELTRNNLGGLSGKKKEQSGTKSGSRTLDEFFTKKT